MNESLKTLARPLPVEPQPSLDKLDLILDALHAQTHALQNIVILTNQIRILLEIQTGIPMGKQQ